MPDEKITLGGSLGKGQRDPADQCVPPRQVPIARAAPWEKRCTSTAVLLQDAGVALQRGVVPVILRQALAHLERPGTSDLEAIAQHDHGAAILGFQCLGQPVQHGGFCVRTIQATELFLGLWLAALQPGQHIGRV